MITRLFLRFRVFVILCGAFTLLRCGDNNSLKEISLPENFEESKFDFNSNVAKADIPYAFPDFKVKGVQHVYVDFKTMDTTLSLKVKDRIVIGTATVEFIAPEQGYPLFDLVPRPTSLKFNGEALDTKLLPLIKDPDGISKFRVLKKTVAPNKVHVMEVGFKYRNIAKRNDLDRFGFTSKGVRGNFFQEDTETQRGFWENYGVSNFEFDQFQHNVSIKVEQTETKHVLFANGSVKENARNQWTIYFPDFFTASSFFIHVAETDRFKVKKKIFSGLKKRIPVTVYAKNKKLVAKTMNRTLSELKSMEKVFGPYFYDKVVIYANNSAKDSMEYVGASITQSDELSHELVHFWFGRGVMPADGSSGWIDEAIVEWRNGGYPRADQEPNRSAIDMTGGSIYSRQTDESGYDEGVELMSELDYMLREKGGLRRALKDFYSTYQKKLVTNEIFMQFMSEKVGKDLKSIFDKFVFGGKSRKRRVTTYSPLKQRHLQ